MYVQIFTVWWGKVYYCWFVVKWQNHVGNFFSLSKLNRKTSAHAIFKYFHTTVNNFIIIYSGQNQCAKRFRNKHLFRTEIEEIILFTNEDQFYTFPFMWVNKSFIGTSSPFNIWQTVYRTVCYYRLSPLPPNAHIIKHKTHRKAVPTLHAQSNETFLIILVDMEAENEHHTRKLK